MYRRHLCLPSLLLLLLLIAGCSPQPASPAVGTWTRDLGRMTIALTLQPGGEGNLVSPAHPKGQPVRWRDENGAIHIEAEGATTPTGQHIMGTLSPDKKVLSVTIGGAPVTLQRVE